MRTKFYQNQLGFVEDMTKTFWRFFSSPCINCGRAKIDTNAWCGIVYVIFPENMDHARQQATSLFFHVA